jgi:transposase-like protein
MRFPRKIILVSILRYIAYELRYRNLEAMMQERGVPVDHATISRWAIRFLPLLGRVFRQHKRPDNDRADAAHCLMRQPKTIYRPAEGGLP